MFRTILWATDGSRTAAGALPHALELAEPAHAKLVVAHVREIFVGPAAGYPVLADESELQARIADQVKELRSSGIDAEFVVRSCNSGHAARVIAEIAKDVEADLIVVGTHGYGRIAGLLIGSTTQGLLHTGVCPVLAIPTGFPRRRLNSSWSEPGRSAPSGADLQGTDPSGSVPYVLRSRLSTNCRIPPWRRYSRSRGVSRRTRAVNSLSSARTVISFAWAFSIPWIE
jgi:nucleotide-binding universal stress UspA family protein